MYGLNLYAVELVAREQRQDLLARLEREALARRAAGREPAPWRLEAAVRWASRALADVLGRGAQWVRAERGAVGAVVEAGRLG
jgi:hypothetical protein